MAIVWTHYWGGTDDGTTLKGIDLRNIQDDLANVTDISAIGVTVQAYDEDLDNLSSPENVSTLNLIVNGAFDTFTSSPTPDSWVVEGGGTEAQETTDVRIGENAYSVTSDADGSASRQTILATIDGSENSYLRGRDVTLSALVYATDSSNARIQIDDGVTTSESSYHTGTPGWELLTVTHTLSATASKLDVVLVVDGNAQEGIFDAVRLNHGKSTWQFSRSPTEDVQSSTFDVVNLTERAAGPTTAANQGAIYTKEVDGQTELFYREESTGDEVQLTSGGSLASTTIFITNGNFVAPDGISSVYLTMVAGGGGGGGNNNGTTGGGGGGQAIVNYKYPVTAGNTYTVVVGSGGAGGPGSTVNGHGAAGGVSSFDSGAIAVSAGGGGKGDPTSTAGVGGGTGLDAVGNTPGGKGTKGGDGAQRAGGGSFMGAGGAPSADGSGYGGGGGGGAVAGNDGGDGADGFVVISY